MAGLREILVSFGIEFDTAPLDKGNAKVESGLAILKQFGAALAGAFAVTKIAGFVEEQVKIGDQLGDNAAILDLSTKSLEEWQYAAQFAEISGEELVGMFTKIARSAKGAEDANSAQGKTLKKLGVNVKDYQSTADVFEAIGTKLAALPEGYERSALAAQFFGRSAGTKILQLFKDGPAGIAKLREEFEALGGGMGDFAKQAGEVDDAQKRLNFAWGVTKTRIAGVFLPALEWGIGKLTKFAAAATKLIDGTHILGTALVVLGGIAVAQAVRIAIAYWPVIAPFLAWAAAIAGVILIGEDLFAFFEGRRSLIGRIIDDMFGPGSADRVREWMHQVVDVVSALIDKVKEIFGDGTKSVTEKFAALVGYILGDFHDNLVGAFGTAGADIVSVMAGATAGWLGTIVAACEAAGKAIKGVVGFLEAPIHNLIEGAPKVDAAQNAEIASGKRTATASDFDTKQKGFFERAIGAVVGFKPQDAVPVRTASASSFGPGGFGPPAALAPPPVVNNITVPPGTPATLAARVGAAAHAGTAAALQAPNRAAAAGLGRTAAKP